MGTGSLRPVRRIRDGKGGLIWASMPEAVHLLPRSLSLATSPLSGCRRSLLFFLLSLSFTSQGTRPGREFWGRDLHFMVSHGGAGSAGYETRQR